MIQIAILGFGVVGSGVAEVIRQNDRELSEKLFGEHVNVKYILDRRTFPDHELGDRVTTDFEKILNDPEVIMVVETMGGSHPAYEFSKRALLAGKNVVTSNKEVVAEFGTELLELAKENNVNYLFEASVGGGIPIIRPMWQCLAANKIESVVGILNGTTNFILTKMIEENVSFADALRLAQSLGYAEADPSADINGVDTCRKICILASLAFGFQIRPDEVPCEGISSITSDDIAAAESLGCSLKLLGRAVRTDKGAYVITAPHLVSNDNMLSAIKDVYNGISVCGNAVGDVLFYGRGAGKMPTASAVVADIVDIARECKKTITWSVSEQTILCDSTEFPSRFMVRASDERLKDRLPSNHFVIQNGKIALITESMTQKELTAALNGTDVLSIYRVL